MVANHQGGRDHGTVVFPAGDCWSIINAAEIKLQ
jgi:hypothetical protein